MPLARILTAFPERADSLARQLRDQGYNVEFLSPEKAGMLRADLEIDFEICDQKVVLRRATELANKLHADIAVSPDVLPANLAPSDIYVSESEIKEVPSHLPHSYVESFLGQGERTGQIQKLEHSEHMVALPPDMLASPASEAIQPQQTIQPKETIQPQPMAHPQEANFEAVHAEAMQSQSAEPVRAEEPVRHIDVPVFPDPERHAEGTFGFETHASHINDHPVAQTGEVPGPVIHNPHEPVTPKDEWMERASALSSAAFAAGKVKSADLWASARRFSNDCAEWINVRIAAAQEKRQRRQIEAQKQQEIARARAEELEIARDAAAVRLQELLRERGGLTDQQPVPPSAGPVPAYRRNEPPAAPGFNNAPAAQGFNSSMNGNSVNGSTAGPGRFERFAAGLGKFKDVVVTRKYGQQWEAVLMGVAAACALFVVGVAVNSFRPHPALSNTITQPSSASPAPVAARATSGSQPYNGVTVQAGSPGVTLKPSVPARPAASQQVVSTKPSPRESDVTVRHFNSKLTSRRSDGSIAQDVTIRHFTQQPKPAAHNSADGVKRFSDLD